MLLALETAASIDADAAEVWAHFQHQRRVGLNEFAVTLAHKTTALRYDEHTMTDTMWMLVSDAHLRLVHDAGWPVEQFQAWLADLPAAHVPRMSRRSTPPREASRVRGGALDAF